MPSVPVPRAMNPGTSDTSLILMSPLTHVSTRDLRDGPSAISAGSHSPVNIDPFSIGHHQPIAFGFRSAISSGVGISPT